MRSSGQDLPSPVRRFMEPRLGRDFGDVRVHTDVAAARSARAVGALAYTVGRDVVFGAGQFRPDSAAGRRLIAHELTHVVQQGAGPAPSPAGPVTVSSPWDAAEREADRAADAAVSPPGHASIISRVTSAAAGRLPVLHRQAAKGADSGPDFGEDPLSADGFGPADQSIRVRPGPVRTTLIRPRITDNEGYTYDDPRLPHSGRTQVDPGAWLQGFIEFFDLEAVVNPDGHRLEPGSKYVLRRAKAFPSMTRAEIIDAIVAEGVAEGRAIDPAAVDGAIAVRIGTEQKAPPSTSRVSGALSVSGVKTGHSDAKTHQSLPPDKTGVQVAIQVTLEIHEEDKSGFELSWTGQATGFGDPSGVQGSSNRFQLQNVATGLQAGWVFAFLDGTLQLEPIVQLLTGFQRGQQTGKTRFELLRTDQVGGGGQIVWAVKGTDKKLQIGGQVTGSYTAPHGAHPTVDDSGTIFLQWKF